MDINTPIILLAIVMSILDCLMMILVKEYYIGMLSPVMLIIPMCIYAVQPLLFYKALAYEGMGIFNVLWDSVSNLVVLGVGLYMFSEVVTTRKAIGVALSFISVYLLSVK